MLRFAFTFCLLIVSTTSFACVNTHEILSKSFSDLKGLDKESFEISKISEVSGQVQEPNPIIGNPGYASCSLFGVKVTAKVKWLENDQVCTATLVKPSYYITKIVLKNVSCL